MSIKIISVNKKASYDYFLEDKHEAGIVLMGSEIKSIRAGNVNLKDAYIKVRNGEAYIVNMHIAPYTKIDSFEYEPTRTRKLLLHKKEIIKLDVKVKEKGYTIIPTKIYLKGQHAKIEFALAKGKKNYDKRESEKTKTIQRNIKKAIKDFNS